MRRMGSCSSLWNTVLLMLIMFFAGGVVFLQILSPVQDPVASKTATKERVIWFSPLNETAETNFKEVLTENESRKQRLRKTCRELGLDRSVPSARILSEDLLWNQDFNFIYCPQAKTGTSTWMQWLVKVSHLPEDVKEKLTRAFRLHWTMRYLLNLPRDFATEDNLRIVEEAFSFAFVRHPFVRFVSTYQDKIIDHVYHENWRDLIPKNYTRTPKSQREANPEWPTFAEFTAFFLTGATMMVDDRHLVGFIDKCDMCSIQYDFIGKTETRVSDMDYVFARTGLNRIMDGQTSAHVSSGGSTEDLTRKYMKTLSPEQVLGLYNYYKADFIAFDYNPADFYDGRLFNSV